MTWRTEVVGSPYFLSSMRRYRRSWACTCVPARSSCDDAIAGRKPTPHNQNALRRAIALEQGRGGQGWVYKTCSKSKTASILVGRYFWGEVRRKEGKRSSCTCKHPRPPRTISKFADLAHRKTGDGFRAHGRVPLAYCDPSLVLGSRQRSPEMLEIAPPSSSTYNSSPTKAKSAGCLGSVLPTSASTLALIPRRRTDAMGGSRGQDAERGRADSTGRPPVPDWRRHKLRPSCPRPSSANGDGLSSLSLS